MGGKKKVTGSTQPRVKNNLKPSSSEKAANFLVQQTGGLGLPSDSFLSSALNTACHSESSRLEIAPSGKLPAFVPVPQNPDAIGLNPHLLAILKRLEKRDATTKQKALRDLCDALQQGKQNEAEENGGASDSLSLSALVSMLPFWPRIYERVSADPDRRVRELVQMAMASIASRVKRELGAYIKQCVALITHCISTSPPVYQLFPVWAFATVDSHEPAATWANQGIIDTFTGSKRSEAYRICARQLLDSLENKLNENIERVAHCKIAKNKGGTKSTPVQSTVTVSDLDSRTESALIRLAESVRFAASLAVELACSPDENPQMQRLRALLAPDNLWSRIAQVIRQLPNEQSFPDHHMVIGSNAIVHISLYKLCAVICRTTEWLQWMERDAMVGHLLASYLCRSTIGQLDSIIRVSGESDVVKSKVLPEDSSDYTLIPPPIGSSNVITCYAQLWDAALTCLLRLPPTLVWSGAIDWQSCLAPQLERLLSTTDTGHVRRVYSNLPILLNRLPITFDEISVEDSELLSRLFIDISLSGLERLLKPPPALQSQPTTTTTNGDQRSVMTTVSDPTVSVAVISGILECATHLTNRLADSYSTLTVEEFPRHCPLLNRLVHDVWIRLLADVLDVSVGADDRKDSPRLICLHPPVARQAYLEAVFSQVARLCANLGDSKRASKLSIFQTVRTTLLSWIANPMKHNSVSFDSFRLGHLDPLRLMQFCDCLAASTRPTANDGFVAGSRLHKPITSASAPNASAPGSSVSIVIQSPWCVQLFTDVALSLQQQLTLHMDSSNILKSCVHLVLLAVYGYLPSTVVAQLHPSTTASFASTLFTVILPNLPEDVHSLCWSRAAVSGAMKSWCESADTQQPIPPASVCERFLQDMLPTVMTLLSTDWFEFTDKLRTLCSNWLTAWIREMFENTKVNDQSYIVNRLNNVSLLLAAIFQTKERQNERLEILRCSILDTLKESIGRHLLQSPDSLRSVEPNMLYTLGLVLVNVLEQLPSECAENTWFISLTQVLFSLYSVQHLLLVTPDPPVHNLIGGNDIEQLIQRIQQQLCLRLARSREDQLHLIQSVHDLILQTVCAAPYLPQTFIQFAEHLRYTFPQGSLATHWLTSLCQQIHEVARGVAATEVPHLKSSIGPARHLFHAFGCLCPRDKLGPVVRLHQFGVRLQLVRELPSPCPIYLQCVALVRGWISSQPTPRDWCTEIGWPIASSATTADQTTTQPDARLEPARSVFGQAMESFDTECGMYWQNQVIDQVGESFIKLSRALLGPIGQQSAVPKDDENDDCASILDNLEDPRIQGVLSSVMHTVLLNRARTIHPTAWPRSFTLAASCTDCSNIIGWSDQYGLAVSHAEEIGHLGEFDRLRNVYLPAGIVRRCLPRQELLARVKSLTTNLNVDGDSALTEQQREQAARQLEVCASLAAVRTTVPIYVSTFLTVFTEDCQAWLSQLADASEGTQTVWTCEAAYRASLASMSFFETMLLYWQPWQWHVRPSVDKASLTNHLGLIQLSIRLQQLRPVLTRDNWDSLLCLIISWICQTVDRAMDSSASSSDLAKGGLVDLFAYRAFRLVAALGSVFVEKRAPAVQLDMCIHHSSAPRPALRSSPTEGIVEDDEDLDTEAANEVVQDVLEDDVTDDEDESKQGVPKRNLLDTLDTELNDEQEDEVLPISDDEDNDAGEQSSTTPNVQPPPLLPRRKRPPAAIRADWSKFFSSHLYSSLLPFVLKTCLPSPDRRGGSNLPDGPCIEAPPRVSALCAAFATCSATQLLHLFNDQPQLVVQYLLELDVLDANSNKKQLTVPVVKQLIQSSSASSSDVTSGLRASFDMACRLLRNSPYQSGQLLGHILLTRLVGMTTRASGSADRVISLSNYLIHRLPTSWLTALYSPLPVCVERDLASDVALTQWGRGSRVLSYMTQFSIQNGWTVDPVAHQSILRYLLAWDGVMNLFTCAGPQTRARLQRALLNSTTALFDRFMLCLGLLLPPPGNLEAFIESASRLEPDERLLLPVSATRSDLIVALSLFTNSRSRRPVRLAIPLTSGDDREWRDPFGPDDPLVQLSENRLTRDISHFAVRLFRRLLAEAPALVRCWMLSLTTPSAGTQTDTTVDADIERQSSQSGPLSGQKPGRLRQLANTIDALVSRHFSTGLARDEVVLVQYRSHLRQLRQSDQKAGKTWFNLLTSSSKEVGSLNIKGRPLSREVIATYQVTEEHSMEILIQLPANYPLGLATVTCGRGVTVRSQQWHVWSVQLSMFINNQNGSILDGIDLWQRNVRKKFEGVEECAICYSVVHNTNFTLPKMQCHTCRKLFHYACMYRWFTTSRNPACPMCRHLFFGPTGRPTTS